jgi:predicted RNA-binding protein YlqC (UPF0109 family)
MKDLLDYIIREATGSDEFTIEEELEGSKIKFIIKADPSIVGLIIGKGGKTIKSIRNIVKVRAVIEKVSVNIFVQDASA